jgi:hypothetical protein
MMGAFLFVHGRLSVARGSGNPQFQVDNRTVDAAGITIGRQSGEDWPIAIIHCGVSALYAGANHCVA